MTDEAQTPAQLIQQWRDDAASNPDAGYACALTNCADELETALAAQLPEQCDCGHAVNGHGASGCLAPAPLGSHRTFCQCPRQVMP